MTKSPSKPITTQRALAEAGRWLEAAGAAAPRLEARLLLSRATGRPVESVVAFPERALSADAAAQLEGLLARRVQREPIARILGRREFWSLSFRVTPDTLIPRPESETVVEAALALVPARDAPLCILDLGTGTGCLLLALLSELPMAEGVGVELSEPACRTARRNAAELGLSSRARFLVGDWGSALVGPFDLVVSNPPYVPAPEIDGLEPEVARFEPRAALAGGPDGLACYRALAPALARLTSPGGHALVELGAGQADRVARIMAGAGLRERARRLDLAGIERCLMMSPTRPLGDEGERAATPGKSGGAGGRFLL